MKSMRLRVVVSTSTGMPHLAQPRRRFWLVVATPRPAVAVFTHSPFPRWDARTCRRASVGVRDSITAAAWGDRSRVPENGLPGSPAAVCIGRGCSTWDAARVVIRQRSLIVLALLAVVGCTGEPDDAPTSPSASAAPQARLEPSCPPAPESPVTIASAEAANTLLAAQNLPAWDAADIGASTLLNDGRVVWVFGDTVRSEMTPGIVANSMLVSGGKCASQLLPAQDGPVIPDAKNGDVYWPMSALSWDDNGRERLVVLCSRTRRGTSGDPMDFAFMAPAAALFEVPPGGAPQLQDVIQVAKNNPDPHQINWGAASFHDGHWIYIYGTRLTGEKFLFGRELYAARVPLASPEDLSTWRYWDSSHWQPQQSRATAVLGAEGGVSQTLSVDDLGEGAIPGGVQARRRPRRVRLFVVRALPGWAVDSSQGRPGPQRPGGRIAEVRAAGASADSAGQWDASGGCVSQHHRLPKTP